MNIRTYLHILIQRYISLRPLFVDFLNNLSYSVLCYISVSQVDTFNNYLKDPERPMPDTISGSVPMPTGLGGRIGGGMGHSQDMMNWGQPPPGMMMGQSTYTYIHTYTSLPITV